MTRLGLLLASALLAVVLAGSECRSDEIACVIAQSRLIGEDERICVNAFDDPRVAGVTCYVSYDRKGGVAAKVGLEMRSRYSMECRQVGPVPIDVSALPQREDVFALDSQTQVFRFVDAKRRVLVYLAVRARADRGSLRNIVSAVPVVSWAAAR
jgi:CreA protein